MAQAGSLMHVLMAGRAEDSDVLGENAQYMRVGFGTLGGSAVQCWRP